MERRAYHGIGALTVLLLTAGPFVALGAGAETDRARQILETAGVRGGLIVHLGCGDGQLTAALRVSDRYRVHGLDADAKNVEAARKHIQSLGLYGSVSVETFAGGNLPYADNLVNLIVAEDPGGVSMDEVMRVLAPRGVACVKQGSRWTRTVKPWPKEIDEWTHFLHDAGNNAVAHDSVVGPPRRMQWVVKPLWLRTHEIDSGVSALVSARGRLFYIEDEGLVGIADERLPETWSLTARDAFNGVLLWKRPISPWGWREWKRGELEGKDWTKIHGQRGRFPATLSRRLVADGDRVFVTLGYVAPLTILDAATGEIVRICEGTEGTEEILVSRDTVVLHIKDIAAEVSARRGQPVPESIFALEANTGDVRWRTQARRIAQLSLAVEGDRVFFHTGGEIVSLNLKNGDELWREPIRKTVPGGKRKNVAGSTDGRTTKAAKAKKRAGAGTLVVHNGVAVFARGGVVQALSAKTGDALWAKRMPAGPGASGQDLFVAAGLVWRGISGIGLDLLTGEEKRTVTAKNLRSVGHHPRCYRGKATDRYLMSAREGIEFLDLQSDNHSRNNWLRGACKLGIMPCNGLVYVPPDQCFCEPGVKLLGFAALASSDVSDVGRRISRPRFEKGPAYGKPIQNPKSKIQNRSDWPTYRHDAARSGSIASAIPADVEPAWRVKLGGKITPPVVADGRLLVAVVDAHTVHAMRARDGEPLWTFTAGGRVDSPPTLYDGRVLFGSADGWVYCLRASDGQLAWRFRAAPEERRIGAFGQLESAWPVHGSVLVQNGVAYAGAGRSSFLDNGIYVYGLDPATGKVLHETRIEGPHPDFAEGPGQCFWVEGTRSEILVGDGASVYMRQRQFDNRLVERECPNITRMGDKKIGLHLFSTSNFLDDSWYNRTFWMYSKRWPGFYLANQSPKAGQLLVFDEKFTYGVKVFIPRNRHSPMFFPAREGYLLFADDNANEPVLVDQARTIEPVAWLPYNEYITGKGIQKLGDPSVDKDKGVGFTRVRPPKWAVWQPIRIRAMVLAGRPSQVSGAAGKTLFVAGPPDVLDPNDPLAAFEGRKGAVMRAISAANGATLSERKLDSPPVLDGLIAAEGRLFMSAESGAVVCFRGK